MKFFVVSDIHGYFSIFKSELEKAGFDSNNRNHFLVVCGDLFDKGQENFLVYNYLKNIKNKVIIRGNHEDVLFDVLKNKRLVNPYFLNGTPDTIREFFGMNSIDEKCNVDFSSNLDLFNELYHFVEELPSYFETRNYIYVHGWLPYENGEKCSILENWRCFSNEQWEKARWTKWVDVYKDLTPKLNKTIICGHYPVFLTEENNYESLPYYGNGFIAIDTGVIDTGRINILIFEDECVF